MQANALPKYTDQFALAYEWLKAESARLGYALFRDASINECDIINGRLVGKYKYSFKFTELMGSPEMCVFLGGNCIFRSHAFNNWAAMLLKAVLCPDKKNLNEFKPAEKSKKTTKTNLSKPITFVPALPMDNAAKILVESPPLLEDETPPVDYSPIAMKMMEKMGYKAGCGLGKAENGIREPIVAKRGVRSIGFNGDD